MFIYWDMHFKFERAVDNNWDGNFWERLINKNLRKLRTRKSVALKFVFRAGNLIGSWQDQKLLKLV